jgi:hypothetical protein
VAIEDGFFTGGDAYERLMGRWSRAAGEIFLDGEDLRRLPIERRKETLVRLLHGPYPGIALNEHYIGHGQIVYRQPC